MRTSRPCGVSGEREHQRSRRVVHHERVLRPGETSQSLPAMGRAMSARSRGEVVLEVGIPGGRGDCRIDRCTGQRGATEVRVQDDAGSIEHGAEPGPPRVVHPGRDIGGPIVRGTCAASASRLERCTYRRDDECARGSLEQLRDTRLAEEADPPRAGDAANRSRPLLETLEGVARWRKGVAPAAERIAWLGLGNGQHAFDVSAHSTDVANAAHLELVLGLRLPRSRYPEHQLIGEAGAEW